MPPVRFSRHHSAPPEFDGFRAPVTRAKDTFGKLLPGLLQHVLDAVLLESNASDLRDKLEIERIKLADAISTQKRLLSLLEEGSSGSSSLDKQVYARLKDVSAEVDRLESSCLELEARLADSTSVVFDEDVDNTVVDALEAVLDPEKVDRRASLHDKLSRVIEHVWLFPQIAAVKRIEDSLIRWIPLAPEAASLIMNPPEIPAIRKHHKVRQAI